MYTIEGIGDKVAGDKEISQFKLTTPYDVSTRSLEGIYRCKFC